jgi:hypothetical protein
VGVALIARVEVVFLRSVHSDNYRLSGRFDRIFVCTPYVLSFDVPVFLAEVTFCVPHTHIQLQPSFGHSIASLETANLVSITSTNI